MANRGAEYVIEPHVAWVIQLQRSQTKDMPNCGLWCLQTLTVKQLIRVQG